VAPPFKEVFFDMIYGHGISRTGEILDYAVEADIIHKSGAWFSYRDEKIGQGRDKAREYLEENPEIAEEIAQQVMQYSKELMDVANAAKQRESVPLVDVSEVEDAENEDSVYGGDPSQISLSDDVTILDIDPDGEDFE
jgi:recombination protein RecA